MSQIEQAKADANKMRKKEARDVSVEQMRQEVHSEVRE